MADNLGHKENMETHLEKDSRKAQDVEFKTDALFFEYETQMLLLLDDFHLQEIADRTLLRPAPAPGVPNPLLIARQKLWDLAKIIYRGLIEQVSGVPRNDGAALFCASERKITELRTIRFPNSKRHSLIPLFLPRLPVLS